MWGYNGEQRVYEVVHSSPEIKTVGEYLLAIDTQLQGMSGIKVNEKKEKVIYNMDMAVKEFLSFTSDSNEEDSDNKSRIFKKYTPRERAENQLRRPEFYLLKTGTKLVIPQNKVNRAGLLLEGLEVVSNSEPAFKAKQLVDLESDQRYTPISKASGKFVKNGDLKQMYPDITIWVWCRSLSPRDSPDLKLEGEIFNITPFVQKVTTSCAKNGGNFNITLSPIVCEMNKEGSWVVSKSTMSEVQPYKSHKGQSIKSREYISDASIYNLELTEEGDRLVRNKFLFHNIIGSNDLVFIRFESLEIEDEQRVRDSKDFHIDKSMLSDRIYDMIGLIDSNAFSFSPNNNDVSIEINGRDLSKLFIEDGTYFYSLEVSQGKPSYAGSRVEDSPLTRRILENGSPVLQYLSLYFNNSIEKVLKFIIQQLSTISIVPDNLFSSYNDVNTRIKVTDGTQKSRESIEKIDQELRKKAIDVIKQIRYKNNIKVSYFLEEAAINLYTPNKTEESTVNSIFNQLGQFMNFLRTKDLKTGEEIRFIGSAGQVSNTIGWNTCTYLEEVVQENTFPSFVNDELKLVPTGGSIKFTKREPDYVLLLGYIDQIIDNSSTLSKHESKVFETEKARGIWQIVKLVIDSSVTKRRILDASLSSANGALLNFIRKICQEPFVEFHMDTYGDKFYLIVRRPPTNKEGIQSLLQGTVSTEEGIPSTPPAIINIEALDIIQENLQFDDGQAYTWYHFTPQANFVGDSSNYSTAAIPALCFEEYGEIWGSKSMDVVHNYSPFIPYDGTTSKETSLLERQTYEDLKFMVDSSAYLPFTRKGSITINGDRRVKVGNLIRYKDTREIFMVDSVQQSYSISDSSLERTTTIQVSRGMVEQFINGADIKINGVDKKVSYFNIINTELDLTTKTEYRDSTTEKPNPDYRPIETKEEREVDFKYDFTIPKIKDSPIPGAIDRAANPDLESSDIISSSKSQVTIRRILSSLHELVRPKFAAFISEIERSGYDVIFISNLQARRTAEQQIALILKYRKKHYSDEAIAAAERGDKKLMETFRHVNGTALDFNIRKKGGTQILLKESSKNDWLDTGVPQLGTRFGMSWGGHFKNSDNVHFEYSGIDKALHDSESTVTPTISITEKVPVEVLDPNQVFRNFKVNKEVFNFFLRREQFNHENYKEKSIKEVESNEEDQFVV